MNAFILNGIHDLALTETPLEYVDMPEPVPGEKEVLLKVKACGVCGSDIPRVMHKGAYRYPITIGHEFAGEVVATDYASAMVEMLDVNPNADISVETSIVCAAEAAGPLPGAAAGPPGPP